ncbi:hypothetical protein BDV27DRAFT_130239 [Aspergillus caelatus]|uniref:Secreted protein n=1 Tax=Aspergillus caelatus TaxID=61420 RepID=A0A5N7A1U3_9EURO|nr:uncharacterized protein BDV27DRAFT_130239 [Aspergillus caelatus]KAE8363179.1 hypothetical protein BDV27DRAFT_130239 [Aspergillus caelatus]
MLICPLGSYLVFLSVSGISLKVTIELNPKSGNRHHRALMPQSSLYPSYSLSGQSKTTCSHTPQLFRPLTPRPIACIP